MLNVVVTGADGFIGKNLCASLQERANIHVQKITRATAELQRSDWLKSADVIYHLAGVNRPKDDEEYFKGNADLTRRILEEACKNGNRPTVVFSSSTQAALDNVYGRSKKAAEQVILDFAAEGKISYSIYRLPGVFGKWARPNYNGVVATFCHNAANGIPLDVRDENFVLSLVYIDDVVNSLESHLTFEDRADGFSRVTTQYEVTLGELSSIISEFPKLKRTLHAPKVGSELHKLLYSTYLSYLPKDEFAYELELFKDDRGELFEWIKSNDFGQIFVSTTNPGVTRGNHFHHTKTEKFLVIRGEAKIRLRKLNSDEVLTYRVSGSSPTVVDIPTGYTHNITNVGDDELITLFWANEIFDKNSPDTYFLSV